MRFIEDYIKSEGFIQNTSQICIKSHEAAWDSFGFNQKPGDFEHNIATKTKKFETCMFAHAPSNAVIDVKNFSKVSFYPGVMFFDNIPEVSLRVKCQFRVLGDGEEIYHSPVLEFDSESPLVVLDIDKYSEITLITEPAQETIRQAAASR